MKLCKYSFTASYATPPILGQFAEELLNTIQREHGQRMVQSGPNFVKQGQLKSLTYLFQSFETELKPGVRFIKMLPIVGQVMVWLETK